jgi:hypothetical protein
VFYRTILLLKLIGYKIPDGVGLNFFLNLKSFYECSVDFDGVTFINSSCLFSNMGTVGYVTSKLVWISLIRLTGVILLL